MSAMATDNTERKQRGLRPFPPGQSGNPRGRPKGSRNKLSDAFIADICASWEEHGHEVIRRVREESPEVYLRVVASLLPKEVNVSTNRFDEMTDEELEEAIRALDAHIKSMRGEGDEPPADTNDQPPQVLN
jgi:hypothetical protein